MEISLTPELEDFVHERVHAGQFADPSEVVREALELLRGQDGPTLEEHEALRHEIAIGIEQLDRGEGIQLDRAGLSAYFEDVKARGIARLEAKRKSP